MRSRKTFTIHSYSRNDVVKCQKIELTSSDLGRQHLAPLEKADVFSLLLSRFRRLNFSSNARAYCGIVLAH